MVLENKVVAVVLLIIAKVLIVHALDIIRLRQLVPRGIRPERKIDKFQLKEFTLSAIFESRLSELILEPRAENRRPGLAGVGWHQPANVRVWRWNAASAQQHMTNHDFLLTGTAAARRTVKEHDRMRAAEEVVRRKRKMKADTCGAIAAAFATFEAATALVIRAALIVN